MAKDKEQNKKTKRKRNIKVPISYCKSLLELPDNEEIQTINFYSTIINGNEYLFDIISTKQKHFYISITDITNGYSELDFNEFKNKYSQPTLFDDFFEI